MARKPTLTAESLIELGAPKLAALILDETKANAAFRKRANAALAGAQGADAVAALIDRRLAALEKARSMVDWRKEREFAADLKAIADTILGELAALDPALAFARLVRFLASHGSVFDRIDDSGGRLQAVYWGATERMPELLARIAPEALAAVPAALTAALRKDTHDHLAHAATLAAALLPESFLAPWDASWPTSPGTRRRSCPSGRPSPNGTATSTPMSRWSSGARPTAATPSGSRKGCSTPRGSTRR